MLLLATAEVGVRIPGLEVGQADAVRTRKDQRARGLLGLLGAVGGTRPDESRTSFNPQNHDLLLPLHKKTTEKGTKTSFQCP